LLFDSTSIFGNKRSKRYALVVEDGKVKSAFVEPDNTGVDGEYPSLVRLLVSSRRDLCTPVQEVRLTHCLVSAAEKVLG
jgi:hypothetical protein